jgi:hypothetical protein
MSVGVCQPASWSRTIAHTAHSAETGCANAPATITVRIV